MLIWYNKMCPVRKRKWEIEHGGACLQAQPLGGRIQDQPWLQSEFQASLSYRRPCTTETERKREREQRGRAGESCDWRDSSGVKKQTVFLQGTWGQFSTSTSDSSQPPVATVPGDWKPSSGFSGSHRRTQRRMIKQKRGGSKEGRKEEGWEEGRKRMQSQNWYPCLTPGHMQGFTQQVGSSISPTATAEELVLVLCCRDNTW